MTGLLPGRTYHCSLVARNSTGEPVSEGMQFSAAKQ